MSTSAPAVKRLMTVHSEQVWGKTPVQSVLKHTCQSNYSGRGLRPCDVTLRSARFEKGVKILVDYKKNTRWIFIIIGWLCIHTLPTHISVQTTKALYDPFKSLMTRLNKMVNGFSQSFCMWMNISFTCGQYFAVSYSLGNFLWLQWYIILADKTKSWCKY